VIVLALFFASGLASLVIETVFRRELALLVGSAATATALTLAIFLGGLALGAAGLGRLADRATRPLRLYALLELGVGVTGGLAVGVLAFGREGLFVLIRAAGMFGGVAAAGLAACLLLPPTILMGGTFPALARRAADAEGRLLVPVARLYAVNTLGGAAGAALSGFVLFASLGVSGTGWLGAALAGAVGASAWALDRRTVAGPARARHRAPEIASAGAGPGHRAAIAVAALGGLAALGYEVVWTRLLTVPLRSYAYSFSLMLSLFLVGLVCGAALLARLGERVRDPLAALAVVQLASGAYVAASVVWLPALLAPPADAAGLTAFLLSGAVRAAPVVIPPTVLSGMALPLAVRAYAPSRKDPGRAVGAVYAANTAGSIVGALVAGLVLLPALGASRSLAVCAALAAAAGAIAVLARERRSPAAWASPALAVACAAAVFLPPQGYLAAFSRAGRQSSDADDVLFYREGTEDTVAVVRRHYGFHDPDAKSVIVDGIAMTATVKPVWRYMAAEGHLPALFAPRPTRALLVCVGTGITLGALASHASVTAVDAVDLSGSMLGALPLFERENDAVFRDAKVRLVHADGRHFLELSRERYGLITLEPPPPLVQGSVHLYTAEFYRLCRAHLKPGGVVAQWLPLHAQSLSSAKAAARTFLDAFPYAQLWLPSIRDAILIGSDRPLVLDSGRLAEAYATPRTRANLEAAYLESPEALIGTYLLDRDGIVAWTTGADRITDDFPWMEFFLHYGRTMSDAEIATLLQPAPGSLSELLGGAADAPLLEAAGVEREAHRLYLHSEIEKNGGEARRAAAAARATHFGLYRMGCDAPQLSALREESSGGEAWRRQVAMCRTLFAAAPPTQ
jgi:spermidine synthase